MDQEQNSVQLTSATTPMITTQEQKQEFIGQIKDIILDRLYKEKNTIITALIDKAKRGDVTALKEVLERALGKEVATSQPQSLVQNNFNLSDEQFDRITLIRAKRISGVLAGSPVNAPIGTNS